MKTSEKIARLNRLLAKANDVRVPDYSDPVFVTWRSLVTRTLIAVFGNDSQELSQFSELPFYYNPVMWSLERDYSPEHRKAFQMDFEIAKSLIASYIEDLELHSNSEEITSEANIQPRTKRVFVSHSSKDKELADELVSILELIGLEDRIFCSSTPGLGVELGDNFLDSLKTELTDDTLVLFLITANFYSSAVCLCEMGAAWVLSKDHIPVVAPPFDFNEMRGVIPLTQGFKINDSKSLGIFKSKIESLFDIESPVSHSRWERNRDKLLARINTLISKGPD